VVQRPLQWYYPCPCASFLFIYLFLYTFFATLLVSLLPIRSAAQEICTSRNDKILLYVTVVSAVARTCFVIDAYRKRIIICRSSRRSRREKKIITHIANYLSRVLWLIIIRYSCSAWHSPAPPEIGTTEIHHNI